MYHVLVLQSNRRAQSTQAVTILALVLIGSLDPFIWLRTPARSPPDLFILFLLSCSGPIHTPSILMLPLSSVPNFSSSSLSSLLLSSNICITSLMDCTPSSISLLLPITVVSSAKRERSQYISTASLLKVSLYWPGMKLPGTHFQCTPSVSCWFFLSSFLLCSAILMTAWWNMLNSSGDVRQPSLSLLSGIQGSLSPSLPLTRYSVVSCMSTMVSIKSPRRPYLLRIPHSAG